MTFCIIVFSPIALNTVPDETHSVDTRQYIFNTVTKYRPSVAQRYTDVIIEMADKYKLDPLLVLQVIKVESRFKWWAKSEKGALGPMQVMPDYWRHILYRFNDKILYAKLMISPSDKYFKRIGYGTEAGCYVLRYYLDVHDQDLLLALISYGYRHSVVRKAQRKGMGYITNLDYIKKVVFNKGVK